jgi:hypothetical protein
MNMKMKFIGLLVMILVIVSGINLPVTGQSKQKNIYFSYTLHSNMNYDRYPKSTIWKQFPESYQNILDFMIQHPDFKGQVQLSGQTFKTLQLIAPHFLEQTSELHSKGQIDFTGTFYSEPLNVSMDGETNLLNAMLGTSIIKNELAETSGFFLQEHAWNPQLPYILSKAGIDWVPVRTTEQEFKPFHAIGLDGTKIVAIETSRRWSNFKDIIDSLPDNAIVLLGGDIEIPNRFIDAYHEVIEINKLRSDVNIEWIRVRDYLKKFPAETEKFINNSDLSGISQWDSYSRWTADPLDIIIHTRTKEAMAAMRAAKVAVFAGTGYARQNGLSITRNPDTPIEHLESFETDRGLDWDIEKASDYPDIEPEYFSRNGEVTLLSRIEHLLAWATNSDARGWWPLFERRQERMESFEQVINISRELMQNALSPIGASVNPERDFDRMILLFNAEKAREVTVEFMAKQPFQVHDIQGKKYETRIFRQGNDYIIRSRINVPDYGYNIIGLSNGGEVIVPVWEEGTTVQNEKFTLKSENDKVHVNIDRRSMTLSVDPFQLRILAEIVIPGIEMTGWQDASTHGEIRVKTCNNDIFPRIRIDRQIDWAVHLRQEYELEPDKIKCRWTFFMPHPTLIRKQGQMTRGHLFPPEGLMARLDSNEPGKIYYDVPFGLTDHDFPSPSYVTMQNFVLVQQENHGVLLAAKTGIQAVQVNDREGSMALALGASTASGPVWNPEMVVEPHNIIHEEPFYSEFFQGEYTHEFYIYPYEGNWNDARITDYARSMVNDTYMFEIPVKRESSKVQLPGSGSFISIDNPNVELTSIDDISGNLIIRLNERNNKNSTGIIKTGIQKVPYKIKPFEILEITLEHY